VAILAMSPLLIEHPIQIWIDLYPTDERMAKPQAVLEILNDAFQMGDSVYEVQILEMTALCFATACDYGVPPTHVARFRFGSETLAKAKADFQRRTAKRSYP
jgi:hypothetical protein